MKKHKADMAYGFSGKFDTNFNPSFMMEYEKQKYKRGILPFLKKLRKEVAKNKKEKINQKSLFDFLMRTKYNHRTWKIMYENGEIYPKEIDFPDPIFIQYAEPHVLITDLYDEKQEWYSLREIIEDFAEEAYLSYQAGFWLASIASSINCVEYIIKYEFFRYLNNHDKERLKKASKDYYFSLGKIKDNSYNCLKELKIKSLFQDKLEYLNLVRNAIYHFNPEKAKKVSKKGVLEIEKLAPISDDMVKPILTFRVISIMLDLLNHFYNRKKRLEYIEECIADWAKKRGLKKSAL